MHHVIAIAAALGLATLLGAQAPKFTLEKATLTADEEIVVTAHGVATVGVESGFSQSSSEFDLLKHPKLTLGKPKAFESAQISWREGKGDAAKTKVVVVFCTPIEPEGFALTLSGAVERKADAPTVDGLLERVAKGVTSERMSRAMGKIDWEKWLVENVVDITTTTTVCGAAVFVPAAGVYCGKQVAGHAKDLTLQFLENLLVVLTEDKVITAKERAQIQAGILVTKTLGDMKSAFSKRGAELYYKLFDASAKALEASLENKTAKLTVRFVRHEVKKVYILIQVSKNADAK